MLKHIKILAIIISFLLLPGLVQYATASTDEAPRTLAPYPKEARLAYMRACVGETRKLIPYCKCMLNALEKRYTLDEMLRITQASADDQAKYANALAKHCSGKK